MSINVQPHIAALSIYSPPWTGLDRRQYLRLDLNENTQAPPACVSTALKALIDEPRLQMYPDYGDFIPRLASYAEVIPNQLIVSNGSDQAIDIILRAFLAAGDEMVIAQPEFPVFTQVANVIGARVKGVPFESDLSFPLAALQQTIGSKTRLIVIINPNNPTGTPVTLAQIEQVLRDNPDIPVIVDEAYYEFTGVSAQSLLDDYENLLIIRTFSKAFAMAGLRLGYVLAHESVITELYKIRGPFDVNTCALVAATAQLESPTDWQQYAQTVMTVSKPLLEAFFDQQSIAYYPSASNFMLVRPDDRDAAVQYLKQHGILVRPMVAAAIDQTFRLSIGLPEEMQQFTQCYLDYLNSRQA